MFSLFAQDDSAFIQGPFSSLTMLEWQRAGYFRSGLLLRREVTFDFLLIEETFYCSHPQKLLESFAWEKIRTEVPTFIILAVGGQHLL